MSVYGPLCPMILYRCKINVFEIETVIEIEIEGLWFQMQRWHATLHRAVVNNCHVLKISIQILCHPPVDYTSFHPHMFSYLSCKVVFILSI